MTIPFPPPQSDSVCGSRVFVLGLPHVCNAGTGGEDSDLSPPPSDNEGAQPALPQIASIIPAAIGNATHLVSLLEFARRVRSGDHEGGMGVNQVQTQ